MITNSRFLNFSPDTAVGSALVEWWMDLHDSHRDERAELHRADSMAEANDNGDILALRAFHRLGDVISSAAKSDNVQFRDYYSKDTYLNDRDKLWPIAILLAGIRPEKNGGPGSGQQDSVPTAMSQITNNDKRCVSEHRFKRILSVDNSTDLIRPLRRTLPLLIDKNMNIDIYDLANAVYYWGQTWRKKNWAYAYFSKKLDKELKHKDLSSTD